ncbi:ComF family protein [Streptomyces sp. NPDC002845]
MAGSQSDWDMYRYKAAPGAGNPSWMRTAGLAAYFGLMHRACLDTGPLGQVDSLAVVPSLSGRPSPHPLQALVAYLLPGVPSVSLSAAPVERGDRDQRRVFRPDFFAVHESEAVRGRHIVLVDDTWVTGNHLQSAAATLRQAGATHVTGLVLARRLRPDWGANAAFITERLSRPYDVTLCPVGEHISVAESG